MYQHYFGLSEAPFSIAPDPRYLFLSDKHREALAHLIYGVGDQGGFVVLTGEVGTGKTTICRCLLQQVPDNADIAFIINPKQSINQLLQSIFNDLGISYESGITSKDLIDQLNAYLLDAHARGRNTILIIDEAQNLSPDVLEQLRLLTNLETNEKKLLQLVLLGQPELSDLLAKPELRQLAQRVTARYHLSPLSKSEVNDYIEHRLSVAGCRSTLFSQAAIRKVYSLSQGVPRLINLICDRSLLGLYASDIDQASPTVVNNAAKEIFSHQTKSQWQPVWLALAVAALIFLVVYSWKNDWLGLPDNNAVPLADSTVLNTDTPQRPSHQSSTAQQSGPLSETSASKELSGQAGSKGLASINSQEWFVALAQQNKPQEALNHLYALWYSVVDFNRVDDCLDPKEASHSVYCTNAIQSIEQIRRYNTPAVLALKTGPNQQGYLLITSLSDTHALATIAGQEYQLELDQLSLLPVVGSFLLTRIPDNYTLPIEPGDSGAAVAWLHTLIAEYAEQPPDESNQGRAVVDSDASTLRNKTDFLYAHSLNFDDSSQSKDYSIALQGSVKQAQQELGFEATAIVDIDFLAALQHKINSADPALNDGKTQGQRALQEG